MNQTIEIVLAGPPMGKERVRVTRTGHAFTPQRTVNYESRLAWAAQEAMAGRPPLEGPLSVRVAAYLQIAASKPKKFKDAALAGHEHPLKKPDVDNIAKMLDALNLIAWVDDSQIVELYVLKTYSDQPRLTVSVRPVNHDAEDIFG